MNHKGKDIKERICKRPGCKNHFTPNKSWQRFCSPGCKDLFWKTIRETATSLASKKVDILAGMPDTDDMIAALRRARTTNKEK